MTFRERVGDDMPIGHERIVKRGEVTDADPNMAEGGDETDADQTSSTTTDDPDASVTASTTYEADEGAGTANDGDGQLKSDETTGS